jgi:phosphotransferase system enzyme I (PtsI)
MRKGIAVSPGVVVGTAYCIQEIFVPTDTPRLNADETVAEVAKFEVAQQKVATELRALREKVTLQVGEKEGAIFATHEAILNDPSFTNNVLERIQRQHSSAQAALHAFLMEYTASFSNKSSHDSFIRERLADVRDVIVRLSAHLSKILNSEDGPAIEGPLVVVADELLPSQAVALGNADVAAIVTQTGSRTSHAAIIARSRGIPAVCGVVNILKQLHTGDAVVVDGSQGHVIISPDAETDKAYRKLEREFFLLRDELAENRDQPATTKDNAPLSLLANINNVDDTRAAVAMGASGVGLFRTEYLYLTHPSVPDEEEQLAIYRDVIDNSPNRSVTIRTLDIGGDKTVPYLGHRHQESNPFMGWRSIRLSFEHPELFTTQLRAIMRAAGYASEIGGEVSVMFPMVTTLEELHRVKRMVRRTTAELVERQHQHKVPRIGMMLEVPAAAVMIDSLLPVVDFVSIGSNDLVQYLMAADRDNPKVSHLCQPLAPAVLRLLSSVIRTCRQEGTPVTLCGEMAGQPRAFLVLLGMGLTSFSMSPAFVPSIKRLASLVTVDQARSIFHRASELRTTTKVNRFLHAELNRIAPDLAALELA